MHKGLGLGRNTTDEKTTGDPGIDQNLNAKIMDLIQSGEIHK